MVGCIYRSPFKWKLHFRFKRKVIRNSHLRSSHIKKYISLKKLRLGVSKKEGI